MTQLDIRYTKEYPVLSEIFTTTQDLKIKNANLSALNTLAVVLFSVPESKITYTTFQDLQTKTFTSLVKDIELYAKNEQKKLILIGLVGLACLVGAVTKAVFGFLALAIALPVALYYFPYEQQLLAIRIKGRFESCEANSALVKCLDTIKLELAKQDKRFLNLPENFYHAFYQMDLSNPANSIEEANERRTFLNIVVAEFISQNKLVDQTTDGILFNSQQTIVDLYSDFLRVGKFDDAVLFVKSFISQLK